jgi:parvulin-like peptidyl-prolyl isomerase
MLKIWNYVLLLVLSVSLSLAGCSSTTAPPTEPSKPVKEKQGVSSKAEPSTVTQTKSDSPEKSSPKANANTPEEKNLDRVLVIVNGVSLTYEQAQILVQHRVARDVAAAAQRWVDIQLRKQEAQRRELDKIDQNAFILQLYADNYLGFRILDEEIRKSIPPATEADARQKYQQQIKNYQRPATFDIQHITMADKTEAEKTAGDAKKLNADFNELVRQHSQAPDKNSLGRLMRRTQESIQRQFGDNVADAVKNAKPGDVLGPLPGLKDFEIIKVISATPTKTTDFEQVKDRIIQQMNVEVQRQTITKLIDDLKAKAKINQSQELIDLEKKAAETARPTPGRPNTGSRPVRTIPPRTTPPTPSPPTPPTPAPKNDK